MIILLVNWLIVFVVTFLYGFALLFAVTRLLKSPSPSFPPALYSLVGLAFVTILTAYASLFVAIGINVSVLLIFGALAIAVSAPRAILAQVRASFAQAMDSPKSIWVTFLLTFLIALLLSSNSVSVLDSYLYHAQAIRWIEEYPAVPGLANLHDRFGTDSTWFITSALFGYTFPRNFIIKLDLIGAPGLTTITRYFNPFHSVNGILFLLLSAYLLAGISRLLRRGTSFSDLVKLPLFIALIYLYSGADISAPHPDMAANLFLWLVFLLFLEKLDRGEPARFDHFSSLILLFSLFAVTLKLSTLPVLLLPAGLLLREFPARRLNALKIGLSAALLILSPWIARTVILTGYLLYPFPEIDLFNLDWKVPPGTVHQLRQVITAWGRVRDLDYRLILAMPFSTWVPIWFASSLSLPDKVIVLAIPGSAAVMLVLGLSPWKDRLAKVLRNPHLRLLLLVLLAGVAFWFFTAPAIRFAFGFIIMLLAVLLSLLLINANASWRTLSQILVLALVVFQGASLYRLTKEMFRSPGIKQRFYVPLGYHRVSVFEMRLGDHPLFFSSPGNLSLCGYSDLPCAPQHPSVDLRGSTLRSGFTSSQESTIP
ncbi:MAG: hypothetical protein OEZ02_01580 [Anaerolineae bacterium]|nr:hypothetical protein [Anaerolineae bacterium]